MSVGTHSKERPLSPIEVAERMRVLLDEYGSRSAVARRLGLKGVDMVNRFLALLKLPLTVRNAIGWRGPQEGEIGLDIAYRISTLDNPREQDTLVKVVIQEPLSKEEVLDIVTLRNKNPEMTIEDCIETRIKIRPIVETGYLLVFEINETTIKLLRENTVENVEKHLEEIIECVVEKAEIESIRYKSGIAIFVLSERGYQQLTMFAKERGVDKKDLLDILISKRVNEL